MTIEEQATSSPNRRLVLGVMGCLGGMLLHLIIGSLYQWGIINIYITSYYRLSDLTLENNAIAFPIMMICYGFTMKAGLALAEYSHPVVVMAGVVLLQALLIFTSSFVTSMTGFVAVYGVGFGLVSGLNFMLPIVECNKYFTGRRTYVNGVILTGTGLGSVVFGLFSFNFLNPTKIAPHKGYYNGNSQLDHIAGKVPQCLRLLSLLYLLIGLCGVLMISYVCIENRRKERKVENEKMEEKEKQEQGESKSDGNEDAEGLEEGLERKQSGFAEGNGLESNESEVKVLEESANQLNLKGKQMQVTNMIETIKNNRQIIHPGQTPSPGPTPPSAIPYPTSVLEAVPTKIYWVATSIVFLGSCGVFLLNGNFKTYVKNSISNDELLTVVGVVGALGNGCSRIFWSLGFQKTGYRFVLVFNLGVQVVVYAALRFTVWTVEGYLFLIFLNGCCLGGLLVSTPTLLQIIFGQAVGSNMYGLFWQVFGLSNLLQFAFVSKLSMHITFNGVIYVCMGMSIVSALLVIFGNLQAPWKNPTSQLGYFRGCEKEEGRKGSRKLADFLWIFLLI